MMTLDADPFIFNFFVGVLSTGGAKERDKKSADESLRWFGSGGTDGVFALVE